MKEIALKGFGIALVDDEDFERINQYTWRLHTNGYAIATAKNIRMHRLVVGITDEQVVDHKDRDKLNNRKDNLRITTRTGNSCNRVANINRGNAFKGVYLNAGRYEARIKIARKPHYLGRFATAEEAAAAYNKAATELHGEMALLNVF